MDGKPFGLQEQEAMQPEGVGEPIGTGPNGGIVWKLPDGSTQELHIDAHSPDMLSMAARAHGENGLPYLDPQIGHGAQDAPPWIPRFADGGIVTDPTLAVVGDQGPEAVVPLSGNASYQPSASFQPDPVTIAPPNQAPGLGLKSLDEMSPEQRVAIMGPSAATGPGIKTASGDTLSAAQAAAIYGGGGGATVNAGINGTPAAGGGGGGGNKELAALAKLGEGQAPGDEGKGGGPLVFNKPAGAKKKSGGGAPAAEPVDPELQAKLTANQNLTNAQVAQQAGIASTRQIGNMRANEDQAAVVAAQEARQQAEAKASADYQAASEAAANMKTDPSRIFSTTGHKIQAGIAIMLGGLGQAFHAGAGNNATKNVGLEMVNRAQEQDIEAQKQDYEHARNKAEGLKTVYGMLRDRGDNDVQAKMGALAFDKDRTANEILAATSQSEIPIIRQQGAMHASELTDQSKALQLQRQQLKATIAHTNAVTNLTNLRAGGGGPVQNAPADAFARARQMYASAAKFAAAHAGTDAILPEFQEEYKRMIESAGDMELEAHRRLGGKIPIGVQEGVAGMKKDSLDKLDFGTQHKRLAGRMANIQAQEAIARSSPAPVGRGGGGGGGGGMAEEEQQ